MQSRATCFPHLHCALRTLRALRLVKLVRLLRERLLPGLDAGLERLAGTGGECVIPGARRESGDVFTIARVEQASER